MNLRPKAYESSALPLSYSGAEALLFHAGCAGCQTEMTEEECGGSETKKEAKAR